MSKQRESLLTEQSQFQIEQPLLTPVEQPPAPQKQRFQSLDILRGLTIIGMLLVDDMYPEGPAWITHTQWNGLTVADLIFPSFVFIMGMAVPFSLTPSKPFRLRNLGRIIGLFAIGLLLNIFSAKFDFKTFRVLGILQRLSLCYGAVSLIHVVTNYGDKAYRFVGALLALLCGMVYMTFMLTFTKQQIGCTHQNNLSDFCNFGSYWDRKMFTPDHMYTQTNDPEGLFTTLSSILNGYAGYLFCLFMFDNKGQTKKILQIWAVASILCGLIGLPLVWLMPINKKIWSISYTFLTIAISGMSLTIITFLVDFWGKDNAKYQRILSVAQAPLIWLGRNPLAIFISRDTFDDICNTYIVINDKEGFYYIQYYLFGIWVKDEHVAAFMFSVFLVILLTLQAWVLFRKGWFLRL